MPLRLSGCSGARVSGRARARRRRSRSSASSGAVHALTNPGQEKLVGAAPHDDKGHPLAPFDAWGHDHLWWLDRMVRTSRPLVERMALDLARLVRDVERRRRLTAADARPERVVPRARPRLVPRPAARRDEGSGDAALAERQRQLALVAERELRAGDDGALHPRCRTRLQRVRRPRAGARIDRLPQRLEGRRGQRQLPLRPPRPRRGREDDLPPARGVHLERRVGSPSTIRPSELLRRKLWSYFAAGTPDAATQRALERLYVSSGHKVRPVVTAVLKHPAVYEGPRLVKSPAVYTAGLLRRLGRGIDTTSWSWLGAMAGQQLFYPPNVAGWDDARWLDTATWRGRWWIAQATCSPVRARPGNGDAAVRRGGAARRRTRLLAQAGTHQSDACRRCSRSRRPPSPTPARRRGSASSTPS